MIHGPEIKKASNELLTWKQSANEIGLYFGRLYVGSIWRAVPEEWRELDIYKTGPKGDLPPQYVIDNIASTRRFYEEHESAPWKGWLMTSEDGEEVGW